MKVKDLIKKLEKYTSPGTEIVDVLWLDEDVINVALSMGITLTPKQVAEVIDWLGEHQDANIGINWATIREAIRQIKD